MPDREASVFHRIIGRLTGRHELQAVVRSLQDLAAAQQQQAATLQTRLRALSDLVSQRSTAKDANEILHAIRALIAMVEERSGTEATAGEERPSTTRMFRALDDIARGEGPIVVGPWTGEIGFEILYWIPFLEWFRTRWRVRTERLVIVSRGGVDSWYGMPGAKYVDIFSFMSPSMFRERAERDKQRHVSSFDGDLLEAVSQRCGFDRATYLHPQLMYRALAPFWKDEAGLGLIARFTHHRRMEPPDEPTLRDLPAEFIAVRFYSSNCFPDKPTNRAVAQAVVDALSEKTRVVVLNPGHRVDDHSDFLPESDGRVIAIPAGTAERNLALQSAVISRARAFVGTYGGYSYLAPFYGVPSVAFYSQQSFKLHHLYVAQRVLEQFGAATVTAVNVAHADVVQAATAGLQRLGPGAAVHDDASLGQVERGLTA
ncbi:MAG TPA: hypothetical protein VIK60_01515 [Vicinamibacterales bacterium]